jgi:beta-galactosidase/beta-glucuronidase
VTSDRRGYPRPQLERTDWCSLDGTWDFAIDPEATCTEPQEVEFTAKIRVPFAPETAMSGIGHRDLFRACWYRRQIGAPALRNGERLLLRFGAVDHQATVWIDGLYVGSHEGGYTPFAFDVTGLLQSGPTHTLVVRAEDDPLDLAKPRGKQDWQRDPHSIWYPRTTGIWQTVWLERVPATRIDTLRWTPSMVRWELGLEAWLAGERRDDLSLRARLHVGDHVLADDVYRVVAGEVHRGIALSDPGIDDSRNAILWSPRSPTLIEAELELIDPAGRVIDSVRSYTALRAIDIEGDRISLNGRPIHLRLVLDQGYWPDSGVTAPDDAALRRDVELVKAMGFNGVRKHQKVEDPRYLYWADRLGLLVWGEMPSAYRFTPQAIDRVVREWTQVIRRDFSHPCIIAWVPVNESWGVPNLPQTAVQRHYVEALYHLTRTLDATRPVIGNDGWESVATDIVGIHDYDSDPERLAHRYHADRLLPQLLRQERPGGRLLAVGDRPHHEHPIVLSEFGGIALDEPDTWGYARCSTPEALQRRYGEIMEVVHALPMLAGFCYTQFADTYQEANGLLYADRRPKFPIEAIREATLGRGRRRG